MANYLQKILNKCRCKKACECLVVGKINNKTGKAEVLKVLGYKCNYCGIQKEADEKELSNYKFK